MVGCGLTYGPESHNNETTVFNFLPTSRLLRIFPLSSNTSYWLNMVCKDGEGGWHASETVEFTTGKGCRIEQQAADDLYHRDICQRLAPHSSHVQPQYIHP